MTRPYKKRKGNKGIIIVSNLWVYVDADVVYEADEQSAPNLVSELRTALHLYGHPVVQMGLDCRFSVEKDILPQPTEVPDLPEGYDAGSHALPGDNCLDIYGDRKFLYHASLDEAARLYIKAKMCLETPIVRVIDRYMRGE